MFGYAFAKAQQPLDIKQFKFAYVDLPVAKETLITQPISDIEVLDARPDNFCLGFLQVLKSEFSRKPLFDYVAINFPNNLKDDMLQNIMPKNSLKKDGFKILLVIKELWLYDNDKSSLIGSVGLTDKITSGLLFKADVYLNRDNSFIPLFKIDSLFVLNKILRWSKSNLLKSGFITFCKKINDFPISKIYETARNVKSKSSIDSFYFHSKQINLPKFLNSDSSHQHIFKTFDDFKNGIYSNADLRKSSDKLGDYYYNKDENGNQSLIRDYAFYSKGDLFIKTNNTYSPIFINQNRVYTIGSKSVIQNTRLIPILIPFGAGSFASGAVPISANISREFQLMMLDMATGNTY